MPKINAFFLALLLGTVFFSGANATSLVGSAQSDAQRVSQSMIEKVKYGRRHRGNQCQYWKQECIRLYGYGTYKWNACMNQPGAIRDCNRAHRRHDRSYSRDEAPRQHSCKFWRRECARFYGRRTYKWYACMNQPNAIQDCQNDY